MNKSKVFFDIEKETKWLNSLAKQGYRLTGKSWFTYCFKSCEKDSYIYQVEKRKPFTSDENLDYLDFVSNLDIIIFFISAAICSLLFSAFILIILSLLLEYIISYPSLTFS